MCVSQAYELLFVQIWNDFNQNTKSGKIKVLPITPGDVANSQWATWTCKLGWPVQGVFKGSDLTDINTVVRSND